MTVFLKVILVEILRLRRYPSPLRMTVFLKVITVEILRLRRCPSPLRMTRWEVLCSIGVFLFAKSILAIAWKQIASATDNHQYLTTPWLYPFDSEINFLAQGDCVPIDFSRRASRLWKQNASATKVNNYPYLAQPG